MGLRRALSIAKGSEERKVGLNVQFPISLKEEFEAFCKKQGVSMTGMILGLVQDTLDEANGDYYADKDVDEIYATIKSMNELIDNHVDENDIGFDPYQRKLVAEIQLKKITDSLRD